MTKKEIKCIHCSNEADMEVIDGKYKVTCSFCGYSGSIHQYNNSKKSLNSKGIKTKEDLNWFDFN